MPESTEPVGPPTKVVTLAWPYDVIEDGEVVETYEPDTDHEFPEHEANRLLLAGLARNIAEPTKPEDVNTILENVGEDADKAAAAIASEKSKDKPRAALIKKLEIVIANAGKEN